MLVAGCACGTVCYMLNENRVVTYVGGSVFERLRAEAFRERVSVSALVRVWLEEAFSEEVEEGE